MCDDLLELLYWDHHCGGYLFQFSNIKSWITKDFVTSKKYWLLGAVTSRQRKGSRYTINFSVFKMRFEVNLSRNSVKRNIIHKWRIPQILYSGNKGLLYNTCAVYEDLNLWFPSILPIFSTLDISYFTKASLHYDSKVSFQNIDYSARVSSSYRLSLCQTTHYLTQRYKLYALTSHN